MTLIVALEGTDALVLAGDSRGTIGDPRGLTAISDTHQKVLKLGEYCGIGISGSSELAASFVDQLQPRLHEKSDVDAILKQTRSFLRGSYDDWFGKFPPQDRPALLLIIAGYNNAKGAQNKAVPRIYLLNSQLDFAPQLCTTGIMLCGIPQYAIYLAHRLYDRDMDKADLVALAAYLITETATQDPKVGGPVKIASITPENGYTELDESAIQEVLKKNDEHSQELRRFFFKGGR